MEKLYIFTETLTNGLLYDTLTIITLLSILCGIFVIISKNPILSVLFLIGLFLSIAGYLMMLGINFIGLSYLLVYVGAVSILFLFILMLINVRVSELITDNNNSIPLAIMIGIFFNVTLYRLLPSNSTPFLYTHNIESNQMFYETSSHISNTENINYTIYNFFDLNNNLLFVNSQAWDASISEVSHITSIGNVIYTVYPLWLILTSIILLLAMVGAIVITIKQ